LVAVGISNQFVTANGSLFGAARGFTGAVRPAGASPAGCASAPLPAAHNANTPRTGKRTDIIP
jgi:hypothetical protein